ncbi:MAG: CoA-binding protein [Acidimicrobiia bacterium]|nr:CoA-binding protein [Acidimicrobiia bacterium]MDH4307451.1 CoA-binding protein [Acidimicrobiia bacterium]MDH5295330.1 CoA-binding protein [Acidimicrobiia bacterium]MDH5520831.1 CoA-binding protein [Acidimicrobiia bacterium]
MTAVDTSPRERLRVLRESSSIAMVGVSANPLRSSNFVATYLTRTPYRVYPVNPMYDEVLGERCYPSLADLPEVPDIVDVFRAREELPGVVREAIDVGAQVVWFQLGLRHDEAARMAQEAGLVVVQDRCLKIEHARFAGGLHLAGFDTGVISSKRRRPV